MKTQKIVITGATGKTAEAVSRIFSNESSHELYLLSSNASRLILKPGEKAFETDILNKKELKALLNEIKPDIIINTAAMTDVDRCETDKKLCRDLNVGLVENLWRYCLVSDSHLITFSTDYIFDGERGPYCETDKPNPLSYYGKSKLAAENLFYGMDRQFTVIRTNVIYGSSHYGKSDFINWVRRNLEEKQEISIVKGQWCNPTFTDDLAYALLKIIEKKRTGVYHIGGADWLNRFDIALRVADVFGLDAGLISPIPSSALVQKARRPEKGGLIRLKAETDLNMKFSSLENGLHALKLQFDKYSKRAANEKAI